mmetsp:Transcript_9893/g.34479  ORF Transcript_9893/g.34479 Transcript_9893/m.34479 type:complete len:545 (+) Transcript_9893:215-1849(+)
MSTVVPEEEDVLHAAEGVLQGVEGAPVAAGGEEVQNGLAPPKHAHHEPAPGEPDAAADPPSSSSAGDAPAPSARAPSSANPRPSRHWQSAVKTVTRSLQRAGSNNFQETIAGAEALFHTRADTGGADDTVAVMQVDLNTTLRELQEIGQRARKETVDTIGESNHVTVMEISQTKCSTVRLQVQDVKDYLDAAFPQEPPARPSASEPSEFPLRWINLPGINYKTLNILRRKMMLDHESVTNCMKARSKPMIKAFRDHLFIVLHELQGVEDEQSLNAVMQQQVGLFYVSKFNVVITVQEDDNDHFDAIRETLRNEHSVIRKEPDLSMLLHLLIDALMDAVQPMLEGYGDSLDGLELIVTHNKPLHQHVVLAYELKRHVIDVRRYAWRMRTIINDLVQDPYDMLSERSKHLLESVVNQTNSVVEIASSYLLRAEGVDQFYESYKSHEMNDILYLLTIFTAVMIPFQTLTGVYGMNFHHMPELEVSFSYYIFWGVLIVYWVLVGFYISRTGLLRKGKTTANRAAGGERPPTSHSMRTDPRRASEHYEH